MDTAWDFEDKWLPKVADVIPYLDLFMPSVEEAAKISGETEPEKIADKFFEMGAKNVIIKVGKDGAYILSLIHISLCSCMAQSIWEKCAAFITVLIIGILFCTLSAAACSVRSGSPL